MLTARGTTHLQTDRLTAPRPLPTPDTGPDTQVALVLSVRGSTPRCHSDASACRGNGGTHNACTFASPRSSQCPRPAGLLLGSRAQSTRITWNKFCLVTVTETENLSWTSSGLRALFSAGPSLRLPCSPRCPVLARSLSGGLGQSPTTHICSRPPSDLVPHPRGPGCPVALSGEPAGSVRPARPAAPPRGFLLGCAPAPSSRRSERAPPLSPATGPVEMPP